MKKFATIFSVLFLFAISLHAVDSTYESTLTELGGAGALVGGSFGIGVIHALFWGKLIAFFLPIVLVVGYYLVKFEQKDRGTWKTIAFSAGGVVVGVLLVTVTIVFESKIYKKTGCPGDVAIAYMQDSVQYGLRAGSYTFGTKILGTGCWD